MAHDRFVIRGGRVVDPARGAAGGGAGALRDVVVEGGRIVDAQPADAAAANVVDARGCVVMAGGVDLHSHIGGGKVNLARMLLPEDHRRGVAPATGVASAWGGASCGGCTPGTLATGERYLEMGYTAAFEPAMVISNARHAHCEMGDVPTLDHGAYVMLGNDELFLRWLHEGGPQGRNFGLLKDYIAWVIHATKAMGVKVVNPGGISAFKFDQRKLDVHEPHVHWQVTPAQVVHTLARALTELGVAHPLHIHGSNLGAAGNIVSTLETIAALEGLPAHLTHVQFHAYGNEGPKKFSSAALALAEAVNARPELSIDVGQILFGQTVTASGDTMRQYAQHGFGSPRKWVGADIEGVGGCGVVPFRYREQSYVNALQWVIGLELFLQVRDPWQIVLTTDHPNGAPFTSYPHLIRLLMDKPFRDAQLARLHPEVAANCALKEMTRELTLDEIAVMTRGGPARLLGLADRGHLRAGAAADIAVYRDDPLDRERMFTTPLAVFKDGVPVVRDGRVVDAEALPPGGVHFVETDWDPAVEKAIARGWSRMSSTHVSNAVIAHDELCACCRGGRLLPQACFHDEGASP